MRKEFLRLEVIIIILVVIIVCGSTAFWKKTIQAEDSETDECEYETVTIIDINDRKKTKSYPDNQEGLVMYVNDIVGFDLSGCIDSISGEIKEPYNYELIARVYINSDSKEAVLNSLKTFRYELYGPDRFRNSVTGIYTPPGKDSEFQQELQKSNVIGCKWIDYGGIHGETCVFHVFVIDNDDGLELMFF